MQYVMWLDNKVPIICGGAWTSKTALLDEYRMHHELLASIDSEVGMMWYQAVLTHSRNCLMPPAQRLFWRTRLEPEKVTWQHMSIYVPLLCTNMAPLSRWIPESKALITVSSTPYLGTEECMV